MKQEFKILENLWEKHESFPLFRAIEFIPAKSKEWKSWFSQAVGIWDLNQPLLPKPSEAFNTSLAAFGKRCWS